jgi:hypothetical protein
MLPGGKNERRERKALKVSRDKNMFLPTNGLTIEMLQKC